MHSNANNLHLVSLASKDMGRVMDISNQVSEFLSQKVLWVENEFTSIAGNLLM